MSSIYQTFKIYMVNEFEGTLHMIKTVRLYQLYPSFSCGKIGLCRTGLSYNHS